MSPDFWHGFTDWKGWVAGIIVGIALALIFFGCNLPTAPQRVCTESGFTNDGKRDTVFVVECGGE